MKLNELAHYYLLMFDRKERANGEKFWVIKEEFQGNNFDSPIYNLVRECHSTMPPNDFIFDMVVTSLELISDLNDDDDFEYPQIEADIYTSELFHWASQFWEYCDQYIGEYTNHMGKSNGFIEIMAGGQIIHKTEIYYQVLNFLQTQLEENKNDE